MFENKSTHKLLSPVAASLSSYTSPISSIPRNLLIESNLILLLQHHFFLLGVLLSKNHALNRIDDSQEGLFSVFFRLSFFSVTPHSFRFWNLCCALFFFLSSARDDRRTSFCHTLSYTSASSSSSTLSSSLNSSQIAGTSSALLHTLQQSSAPVTDQICVVTSVVWTSPPPPIDSIAGAMQRSGSYTNGMPGPTH